ncbi:MAG: EAL domain-containing protein [Pseudomonadota bacterium]
MTRGAHTSAQRRVLRWAAAASIAAVLGLLVQWTDLLAPLNRSIEDHATRWAQRVVPSDAVIVEIDAGSIRELGTWPWPRRFHAAAIDVLLARHARQIFLDIDFSAASNPADDSRLAASVRAGAGILVLPSFWQRISATADNYQLSRPMEPLRAGPRLGSVNLSPGEDGLVRDIMDLAPEGAPPVAPVARVLASRQSGAVVDTLDFRIAPESFRTIPFADLLLRPDEVPDLTGMTVMVGATALELGDMVSVPLHGALPGVLVQAIAYQGLQSSALHFVSTESMSGLILLCAALSAWLLGMLRPKALLTGALVVVLGTLTLAWVAYSTADLIVHPMALIATSLAALLATLVSELDAEAVQSLRNWLQFKRQDALLREIVAHSADAILTVDSDGNIRTANPGAAALFRRNLDTFTALQIGDLVPELTGLVAGELSLAGTPVELTLRQESGIPPTIVEVALGRISADKERILVVTLRDITEQKSREAMLRYHATHDSLTGMPNRLSLSEQLERVVNSERDKEPWALVLLDLDGFKQVNDTLGHSVGDSVLKALGHRLVSQAPDGACVARLGGDEFAIFVRIGGRDEGELQRLCEGLLLTSTEPVLVRGVPITLGMSAGIACWPKDATDAETLLQRADVALYAAKRRHTSIEFYDAAADGNTPRRLEMLTLLRTAAPRNELTLRYQPKVCLQTGLVVGVEALCRWHSPELGNVTPAEFIPLAEASDLIAPLTRWTLRQALLDCHKWHAAGMDLKVAVNLSARHLQDSHLANLVEGLLRECDAPPHWLELEITESAIMNDPRRAFDILQSLRALGISLSIDDFGTGYSSLAYLQRLKVDGLKIDKSFIDAMDQTPESQVIVASTIQLGRGLGLELVAEGVETEWQEQLIRDMGCHYGQGYLHAKPVTHEEILGWRTHPARRNAVRLISGSGDSERGVELLGVSRAQSAGCQV